MTCYCARTGDLLITVEINFYDRPIPREEIKEWLLDQGWQKGEEWFGGTDRTYGYHLESIQWSFRYPNHAMMFKLVWA